MSEYVYLKMLERGGIADKPKRLSSVIIKKIQEKKQESERNEGANKRKLVRIK